jgi:membrane fusion protein (multidrug efflux system)
VPVEIALASLGDAARSVAATGTIEPIRSVGVNSQIAGALLRVLVEEGDAVRVGQVLAEIDSRELEAQLTSATANLEVAKRTAERSQQLRRENIITVVEYDRDQAAYAAAKATHEQLATRLGYATVRAPIGGVILDKRLEAGDIVGGQTRLFTIGDVSTLVVRVPVSELDVAGLGVGDPVDLTLDALPGRLVPARIRRVFPSADTLTRLIPVEVALTSTGARGVRPGFLARVNLRLDPRTDVLMVPAPALLEDPSGSIVYMVRDGKASRQRVRRGGTFQGRVEILEGLAAGDSVIVNGNNIVRDGGQVRIVSAPTLDSTVRDAVGSPANGDTTSTGGVR